MTKIVKKKNTDDWGLIIKHTWGWKWQWVKYPLLSDPTAKLTDDALNWIKTARNSEFPHEMVIVSDLDRAMKGRHYHFTTTSYDRNKWNSAVASKSKREWCVSCRAQNETLWSDGRPARRCVRWRHWGMELSSCFHPLYMGLLGGWAPGRKHGYQLVDKNDNLPQRRTKSQSVRRDRS